MALMNEFPKTFKALSTVSNSGAIVEHIEQLEAGWASRLNSESSPRFDQSPDYDCDVILIGGGLSLLYALVLAKQGNKVIVADRNKIGKAHREWNISFQELEAFENAGIFIHEELDDLIKLQYERGIIRWYQGEEHSVSGVLDCAIDAQRLLDKLRSKARKLGLTLLDYHELQGYEATRDGVSVSLNSPQKETVGISSRLLLDGRGAQSGHGNFDIVCPTVGGVISGLDQGTDKREVNPQVGEILVTTEGIENGRQHIWEGFPIADELMVTYLFYYTDPGKLSKNPLFSLYERFFERLSDYKVGVPRLEKATYGFIPGNTRLNQCSLSPSERVYLVGDAAGLHSPLTFCGFGSIVRTFESIGLELSKLLREDRLDSKSLNLVHCEAEGLKVMGGLALMMVAERLPSDSNPQIVNGLLDDAFTVLSSRGDEMFRDFMQDRIQFKEFIPFMLEVARKRPKVWGEVYGRMSSSELKEYLVQIAKFGMSELKNH